MSIAIDLPPQIVQEARGYAVRAGTSLKEMIEDCVMREFRRRREKDSGLATTCRNPELLTLAGSWIDDPEMQRAFAEMDKVDEDLWK